MSAVGRAAIELHRIATDVGKIPDAGLIAASKLVKNIAEDSLRHTIGGVTMQGKKKKALKLRARDTGIRPLNNGRAILVIGIPTGPWVWANTGTDAHDIRRRKRKRAGESKLLTKMTVRHPGTRGKNAWKIVVKRSEELVPRIFQELADTAVN